MEIALQAVRVYGSKSQYGSSPRLCPTDGCLALEGYPRPGERCVVLLGAPSESVLRANQVRRAIGYVLLSGHFGQAPDPEAERDLLIGKALDEGPTPSASDYNWYVTLVLERRVSVADGSVADRRYLWLDFGEAMRLESELLTYARPQIDLLATCVSTVLGKIFFHVVALEDRVFFSAPGRESFGLPEFSFPRMTVNAGRSDSTRTAILAPRERASRPSAPVPANRSRTDASSVLPPRMLKIASRTRSAVGRTACPLGVRSRLPRHFPDTMRTRGYARAVRGQAGSSAAMFAETFPGANFRSGVRSIEHHPVRSAPHYWNFTALRQGIPPPGWTPGPSLPSERRGTLSAGKFRKGQR